VKEILTGKTDPVYMGTKANMNSASLVAACLCLVFGMGALPGFLRAQANPPSYEVDPSWPQPLPNKWVTGSVGGVCTDAQDHVFIVNRQNLTDN